ncbi:MAG: hypothetical protein M0P57_05505 [Syntrophales bacterium]|nr:hypothetical protein [Syntrophales bacterium]MDY0044405.1 hypothetical protein [Syntrophales bacterium]
MASKKKEVDFNEYFEFLWEYAQSKGISKGLFMKNSGLSPQRFSEFSQKTRNVTGEYFLKMLSGVELSPEEAEKESGRPFSPEQSAEIRFDSFVKSEQPFLEELMRDPAKLHLCKTLLKYKSISNNKYVKRLLVRLSKLPSRRSAPQSDIHLSSLTKK